MLGYSSSEITGIAKPQSTPVGIRCPQWRAIQALGKAMDGTPSQLQLARSVLQRHGQHSSDNASGPSTLPSCALRSRSISTPLLPCLLTFFPPPTAKIVNDPIQTSAKSLAAWWSASCPRRSLLLLVLLLVFSSFSWVSVTFLAEHSWPYKSPPFPSLLFFSAPPSVSVPPPPSCLSRRFCLPPHSPPARRVWSSVIGYIAKENHSPFR